MMIVSRRSLALLGETLLHDYLGLSEGTEILYWYRSTLDAI
jgi:hypothetical protein